MRSTPPPAPPASRRLAALALLTAIQLSCEAGSGGPRLEIPDPIAAVEVSFGDGFCRRLEEPSAVADLVAFAERRAAGWQAAWTEGEPPRLRIRYLAGAGTELDLGLGDGQLWTQLDGRSHFQALPEAERRELLERLGGPPRGVPENPCRSFGGSGG